MRNQLPTRENEGKGREIARLISGAGGGGVEISLVASLTPKNRSFSLTALLARMQALPLH